MALNAKWPFTEGRSKTAHGLVRASAKKASMLVGGKGGDTPRALPTSPLQDPRQSEARRFCSLSGEGGHGLGLALWP